MSKATFTLGDLADKVTGGNLVAMAGLLNDVARGLGLDAQLDENEPNPGAQVAREAVINLAAYRAGDRVGRALAKLLVEETGLAGRRAPWLAETGQARGHRRPGARLPGLCPAHRRRPALAGRYGPGQRRSLPSGAVV